MFMASVVTNFPLAIRPRGQLDQDRLNCRRMEQYRCAGFQMWDAASLGFRFQPFFGDAEASSHESEMQK
jgi:hypothetical protein